MMKNKIKTKIVILFVMTIILFILTILSKYQLSIINKRISLYLLSFAGLVAIVYLASLYKDFGLSEKVQKGIYTFFEYFNTAVLALIFINFLTFFMIFPKVRGISMEHTLYEGERLVVQRHTKISRFDIVVFYVDDTKLHDVPESEIGSLWVKRVIGLPGDRVTFIDGKLYINDTLYDEPYLEGRHNNTTLPIDLDNVVIPEGYYLLLGDNRPVSNDSRIIGLVSKDLIVGEVKYVQKELFLWEKVR